MPPEICSDGGGHFFSSPFSGALYGLVHFAEILFFLSTMQHTRWDSSAHTVTQAFRHSLAPTNTISVTFHYMVLGWISGLETYQISTQGALPPHSRYCLSATMSNCFAFALFMPKILICTHNTEKCTNWTFLLAYKQWDLVFKGKSRVAHIPSSCGSSC